MSVTCEKITVPRAKDSLLVSPHALTGSRTRRSFALMGAGIRAEWRIYILAIGASALFGGLTVAVSQVLGKVTDTIVVPAVDLQTPAGRAWQIGRASCRERVF